MEIEEQEFDKERIKLQVQVVLITRHGKKFKSSELNRITIFLSDFACFVYLAQIMLALYRRQDNFTILTPYYWFYPRSPPQNEEGEGSQTNTGEKPKGFLRGLPGLGGLKKQKSVKIEIPQELTRDNSKKSTFFPNRRSSEPPNIEDFVKTYFINQQYFRFVEKKIIKAHRQEKDRKNRFKNRGPQFDSNDDSSSRAESEQILLGRQKFRHDKVRNLQGVMQNAWDFQRKLEEAKNKKLYQAASEVVFKFTPRDMKKEKTKIFTFPKGTEAPTRAPFYKKPDKLDRRNCDCVIF